MVRSNQISRYGFIDDQRWQAVSSESRAMSHFSINSPDRVTVIGCARYSSRYAAWHHSELALAETGLRVESQLPAVHRVSIVL